MTFKIEIDYKQVIGKIVAYERELADLTQVEAAKLMDMRHTTYREKEYGQGLSTIFLIRFSYLVLNKRPNYMFEKLLKFIHENKLEKDLFRNSDSPP